MRVLTSSPIVKFLAGVAVAAAVACAQPSFGWEATVRPPRPGLPAVEIRIGFPGDYVPLQGSPLELRRTAPFDGMIGYRFEVDGKKTVDTTRLTRAAELHGSLVLDTRGEGSAPREVVIEWRDAAGHLLASANAGTPPWSAKLKTLRVGDESPTAPRHLGEASLMLPPAALPARAEWYDGWRALVLPAESWLALAANVRQAIVASGASVMTFGTPAPRALAPVDEAVLPVAFDAGAVRPKPGADWLRGANGPRLVRLGNMTWAASEDELREPLPAMQAWHFQPRFKQPSVSWSPATAAAIVSQIRTLLLLAAAVMISLLLWHLIRRGRAMVAAAIAVALIVAHPLYRDFIRPRAAEKTTEQWSRRVNGTYERSRFVETYGATPLRMREPQPADARLATDPAADYAELAPDGRLLNIAFADTAWPVARVRSSAAEAWDGIRVTIREAGDESLTFEYDLAFEPSEVLANWTHGTGYSSGAVALPRERRGRATVTDRKVVRMERWWAHTGSPLPRRGPNEAVELLFIADGRTYRWRGALPASRFVRYELAAQVREQADGRRIAQMVIPESGIPPAGQAVLTSIYTAVDILPGATIEGDGGTIALRKHTRPGHYTVAADDLRRITADHGLVTIHTPAPVAPRYFSVAQVRMSVEDGRP